MWSLRHDHTVTTRDHTLAAPGGITASFGFQGVRGTRCFTRVRNGMEFGSLEYGGFQPRRVREARRNTVKSSASFALFLRNTGRGTRCFTRVRTVVNGARLGSRSSRLKRRSHARIRRAYLGVADFENTGYSARHCVRFGSGPVGCPRPGRRRIEAGRPYSRPYSGVGIARIRGVFRSGGAKKWQGKRKGPVHQR